MTPERHPHNNAKPPSNTTDRALTPPHNIQAEEALLGAALLTSTALEVLATKVVPADFYSPAHQKIATVLIAAFENSWPADPVTIADVLNRSGDLEVIGGSAKLVQLQANTPATSNAGRYAEIVHNDATLRRLINASTRTSELAHSRPFDVHEAVEQAQSLLIDVASQNGSRAYSSLDMPDMAQVIAGDISQEQPTILTRDDGQALFYAGKMHVLQAEPSSGKSWIALFAAIEILHMGGSVVYLDYEDSSSGIVGRLLALGGDPTEITERFQYVRPSGAMGTQEKAELASLFAKLNPDMVVIDGVAEAISRDGFDEDKNSEVVKWVDQFPRWIAQTGSSVVMIDHIAKDKDRGGRYARGAGHKLAAVDGASYQVKILHSFSRHRGGSVKLIVAKDRPGVFSIGETAAVIQIEPSGDGTVVRMRIEKDRYQPDDSETHRPTRMMERLSMELERVKAPVTASLLLDMVAQHGKPATARDGLARLQAENFVSTYKMGHRQLLRLLRPYRVGDGPAEPPAVQQTLTNHERRDDGDPGPTEPTD
jgi:KaiC/GvpD/RAD55 family RecA-like ATPase